MSTKTPPLPVHGTISWGRSLLETHVSSAALWIVLGSAATTFLGLWYFQGEMPVVMAILYVGGLFLLSILRLDYSLYLLLACVMTFDQFAIPGFEPLTKEISFFNNIKEIPYLVFFDAGVINPLEVHLIAILLSLMAHTVAVQEFRLRAIPVWIPFLLFFGSLLFSFAHGLRGGGDFMVALWEIRALFYLCIFYLIVPQIIQNQQQLRIVVWIFIIGITIKALQGVGRFVALGFTTGGYEVLTNHEDPVFMVTMFLLLMAFITWRTGGTQMAWLLILLIPILLGFYVGQRRASYASLMVCVTAFAILLPSLERRSFLKIFLTVMAGVLLYGFLFWNSTSVVATPVQMVKSGLIQPDLETNARDYHSNLYRSYENYNLAKSATRRPLFGTGFGKRYDQPIPLINIRFPLRDYIPHNQIFWVLVKMGGIGFLAFWFFFNSFVAKGTQVLMRLRDPYLKAITVVIVLAIINQMVVSYFDLQLTYYRNMIYLGTLMGLLPAIESIDRGEPEQKPFPRPTPPHSDDDIALQLIKRNSEADYANRNR